MIENWFCTPILCVDMEDHLHITNEIDNVLKNIKLESAVTMWNDTVETSFKYNNSPGMRILESCSNLKTEIIRYTQQYTENINLISRQIDIVESWINKTSNGQFQHYHSHPTFDLSGVYYHSAIGSGADGEIVFKTPSTAANASKLFSYFPNTVKYVAKPGRLILFPSFLEHCVNINKTEHERISLSFNILLYNTGAMND